MQWQNRRQDANFNPRSHERSDICFRENAVRQAVISIHAPTRGATAAYNKAMEDMHISIHAPTRGATKITVQKNIVKLFQSTLPREERRKEPLRCQPCHHFNPRSHERSDISKRDLLRIVYHFNPRSHERSDGTDFNIKTNIKFISIHAPTRGATLYGFQLISGFRFQSTLPREERHIYL